MACLHCWALVRYCNFNHAQFMLSGAMSSNAQWHSLCPVWHYSKSWFCMSNCIHTLTRVHCTTSSKNITIWAPVDKPAYIQSYTHVMQAPRAQNGMMSLAWAGLVAWVHKRQHNRRMQVVHIDCIDDTLCLAVGTMDDAGWWAPLSTCLALCSLSTTLTVSATCTWMNIQCKWIK